VKVVACCLLLNVMMLYAEEGADGNSAGCEDGVNVMMLYMEKGVEVNSDGCEDRANYLGYKLYVVNHEFPCVCCI